MKLRDKIELALRDHPETREDDRVLTIHIWKKYHGHHIQQAKSGRDVMYVDSIFDLPTQESIKRERARFNENGKYLPSNETVLKRRRLDKKWKLDHGYKVTN